MSEKFEEVYADVLQNLEFAIVSAAREVPELVDYDVESALDNLIRHYNAEEQNRIVTLRPLNEQRQLIFERVQAMAEWRLGRTNSATEQGNAIPTPAPISVSELVACLKRIRKSVQRWNKQGGRQGYLNFVNRFIV